MYTVIIDTITGRYNYYKLNLTTGFKAEMNLKLESSHLLDLWISPNLIQKIHVDLTKIHISKVRKFENEKYEPRTFQNF